ncbi:MAG: DNA polymerase [Candidatus Thorarchaeota archaeon]
MSMKVQYITTRYQFETALADLWTMPKLCADFETLGLDARVHDARLLQLCSTSAEIEDRTIYVIDFFKCTDTAGLKELLTSREMLLFHNANFDLQFLLKLGIDFKHKIFDTFIAERCLVAGSKEKKVSPNTQKVFFGDVSCSLKAVASRRLDLEISKEQQVSDWSKEDLDIEQIEYAARDVDILPKIAALQLNELAAENLLDVYTLESKIIRPVALMCHYGFNVDVNKLRVLKARKQEELDRATRLFCESLDSRLPDGKKLPKKADGTIAVGKNARKEFNPGSNVQCIKHFNEIGTALPADAITGKQTLSQVALSEFNSHDETLNLLRQRTKIETSLGHVEKIGANLNPVDGRMHSGYNTYGANSGRFTSSGAKKNTGKKVKIQWGINIQQVPRGKEFRECFVPSEGYKFVIADYSQIELRLGAELIGIPQMIKAFQDDLDLHTLTASLVYNCGIEEVTKNQRQMGKTLNFALLYGMGFRKYKTYSALSGNMITLTEAKAAHTGFHRAYPRLREWHKERNAMVDGGWTYVRTPTGRRRLLSYDDATMSACANTLIQGAGADILKIAIAKLGEVVSDEFRPIATVHDELVFEALEDKASYYKGVLEETMKEAAESVLKIVPVKCDANVASSWAEK